MRYLVISLLSFFAYTLCEGCQPVRSAADVARESCESGLVTELAVLTEAEIRNVPAQNLAKTFCAIEDIWRLWNPSNEAVEKKYGLSQSEIEPGSGTGELTPSKQAVKILIERKEIQTPGE